MTDNNNPSPFVASGSNEGTGNNRFHDSFDGTLTFGGWNPFPNGPAGENVTLYVGAGNGVIITAVRLMPHTTAYAPQAFSVQGSNDDVTYDTLASFSGLSSGWTNLTFRDFSW